MEDSLRFVDSSAFGEYDTQTVGGVDVHSILLKSLLIERVRAFVVLFLALHDLGIVTLEHALFDGAVVRCVRGADHRVLIVRQRLLLRIRRSVWLGQCAQCSELLLSFGPTLRLEQHPTCESDRVGAISLRRDRLVCAFERQVKVSAVGANLGLPQDGIDVVWLSHQERVVACLGGARVALLFV